MLAAVVVLGCVLTASAGPVLYPVLPAAHPGYYVRTYAAAAPAVAAVPAVPAVPAVTVAPVAHVAHVPTSYSHVSHTQYTSHPVPYAVHAPLLYHAPAALVV